MGILFIIIFIVLFFTIWFLPISIAKGRGMSEDSLSTVKGLTYLTIIFPPLWLIALICSMVMGTKPKVINSVNEFERLDKLYEVYGKGLISDEEFERKRKEIMG